MKIINYLSFAAALFCAAALFSCNGDKDDDPGAKLLEGIWRPSGVYTMFEYDTKNRIVKVSGYTDRGLTLEYVHRLTYSGSALIQFDNFAVTSSGKNQVTVSDGARSCIFDLNGDHSPTRLRFQHPDGRNSENIYQYDDGNLTKLTCRTYDGEPQHESTLESFYDIGHAPFLNCKTPKWWLIWQFERVVSCMENTVVREEWTDGAESGVNVITYDFDEDDYPYRKYIDGEEVAYYTYNQ